MQSTDYFRVLRRQWLLILLCAVLGVGAGIGAKYMTGTKYRSQTQVIIAVTGATNAEESSAATTYLATAIDTYASAAGSLAVLGPVADKMTPKTTGSALAQRVTVDREPRTFILNISATADTGQQAAELADAVAQQTIQTLPSLAILPQAGQQKIQITQLAPANTPENPTGVTEAVALGGGALLGLITGLSLGVMRDGRRRPRER